MKKTPLSLLLFFLTCSCTNRVEKENSDSAVTHIIKIENSDSGVTHHSDTTNKIKKVRPTKSSFTTIYPFKDTAFKLSLNILNSEEYDEEKNNSTVTFTHFQNGEVKRIFEDSFYCMDKYYEFRDFNNDRIKDVLIFYYSGGSANPTYHLYLADTLTHKLVYVKGFEELPSPDLDSANNIIVSLASAGSYLIYKFYRINSKDKLIDLGNGLTTDLEDSIMYEKAIHKIIKAHGK